MNNLEIYPKNYTDRIPYFYIIRHRSSGMLYAGSRWKIGCKPEELLTEGGYITSSGRIKEIIKSEGLNSFEIYLTLTEAECGLDVFHYETRFLRQYNISNRKNWYNGHDNFSSSAFSNNAFKKNMKAKYGFEYSSQVPEINERMKNSRKNKPEEEKQRINKLKSRPGNLNGMYGTCRMGKDNPFYGKTHTEENRSKFSDNLKDKVIVKDESGNTTRVSRDDPRYISKELVSINCGWIVVKNESGQNLRVPSDDPRFLNGELVSINKDRQHTENYKDKMSKIVSGMKWYNNGVTSLRSKTDPGGEWLPGRIKWAKI